MEAHNLCELHGAEDLTHIHFCFHYFKITHDDELFVSTYDEPLTWLDDEPLTIPDPLEIRGGTTWSPLFTSTNPLELPKAFLKDKQETQQKQKAEV